MAGDDSMIILPPAVHLLFPPSPFASHPPSLFAFSGGCGFSHSVKANSPSPPQSPRSSVSPLSLFVLSVFFFCCHSQQKKKERILFSLATPMMHHAPTVHLARVDWKETEEGYRTQQFEGKGKKAQTLHTPFFSLLPHTLTHMRTTFYLSRQDLPPNIPMTFPPKNPILIFFLNVGKQTTKKKGANKNNAEQSTHT